MNNSTQESKQIPLTEVLVKTTYFTQSTHPSDTECSRPMYFGCGFMIRYKDETFFVTADHNLHPEDYDNETKVMKRTWVDYTISIFNNVKPVEQPLSTVITPLGGFFYMEKYDIMKPKDLPELMDVCVCMMKPINFTYPFLTDEVVFSEHTINVGEQKFCFIEDMMEEPRENMMYFVFGKINAETKGIRIHSENTLKENLRYICKSGDFYLLETPDIVVYEEWAGLSGSPVISEEGNCIGVLCSVLPEKKIICVMSIEKVKMLLDLAILENGKYKDIGNES
ncbi:hypothetical protein M2451_002911 [Dysgonomonas sp. PFB1-18]|uniref:hypothetical protein n=1 Tax=unclassified Dysgonomonas TaxID=2630389 RepID=UPI0013D6DEF5|nr:MULTISPECIES: hypothetical protein [unclassified Dysgonomonas]MDH6310021.1 hypothetical protein [Dysgonomonas sp. PF1-14]MDH6339930.1 hypothetical protein [Dysgonomonas sp. PF1-16]MDH6381578.1 hypothetical protein [Dysgonomonas sp. PFB1-18]MDH6398785.1 hypothetical protein [Dysgonomonas sp. PF1-23]NDV93629.1 hypothetical protein [Dysgonomonas sp. 521]